MKRLVKVEKRRVMRLIKAENSNTTHAFHLVQPHLPKLTRLIPSANQSTDFISNLLDMVFHSTRHENILITVNKSLHFCSFLIQK